MSVQFFSVLFIRGNNLSMFLTQSAKTNCKGDFVNIDPENGPCVNDMKVIDEASWTSLDY